MAERSVSADSEFVMVKPVFPDSEDSEGSEFVDNVFALTFDSRYDTDITGGSIITIL